eukprot:GFUD01009575.1.p1 GENE.GFUD01009575.1~~GFUD01009575.1.p1  ORF type:complete len:698 (-),score=129.39 GFUD01009575.1:544-2637(-)
MSSIVEFCHSFSKMTTYMPDLANQQSSMPSLKPHAQAHLLSATDKCKICAEPAARHIHYGATTCFSCRAFFRRSLQNKTAAKYVCRRHSMCEMKIKTRKNCQYCRYMKCLAVGMNPTYVLTEEERKRRFKKRNISINIEGAAEEPNTVVHFAMSVPINTTEESAKFQEIRQTKEEKIKTDNTNPSKIGNFNEVFQKYAEGADHNSYANESKHSPYKRHSLLEEMKQYRKFSQQKKTLSQQRELAYFKTPYPPPPADLNDKRGIKALRNENTISSNELATTKDAFIDKENNKYGIKEGFIKNIKDEEKNTYFDNETKPTVQIGTFLAFSAQQNPENLTNKGQGQLSETYSSSDSEDEIELKLQLSHEPEIIFTEDEKHQLDNLVSDHDKVYHSVNFGEVLIKEMMMCSMFGVSVSTSAAIQGYRLQVERITRIANSLKCFTDLQKVDQVALLKENADLLVSLHGAIFFDKKKKGMDQLMSSMGIGLHIFEFRKGKKAGCLRGDHTLEVRGVREEEKNKKKSHEFNMTTYRASQLRASFLGHWSYVVTKLHNLDDMGIIKQMFKPLIQTHAMNHIDYKTFNSIQDPANKVTEERNIFLQGKVADVIMDNITTILLTYIILFSSDFCSLEDRKSVERNQHFYLRMLERFIYSGSGHYRACCRMAQTLHAVTCVREMADIKKSRAINYNATAQCCSTATTR